jgi:hypothetical protein
MMKNITRFEGPDADVDLPVADFPSSRPAGCKHPPPHGLLSTSCEDCQKRYGEIVAEDGDERAPAPAVARDRGDEGVAQEVPSRADVDWPR